MNNKPPYSDWLATVPPDRFSDLRYDLEKAYNSLDFDTLERWRTSTIVPSMDYVGGYDFLKRSDHPSSQKELDWYNGDSEDAKHWRSSFDVDTSGDFYKYVPKPGAPMSAPFSHNIPEVDAEAIWVDDDNGYYRLADEGDASWPFPLPKSPFPSSTNSFTSSEADSARDLASQILVDRLGTFGDEGHYHTRIPESALSQVSNDILSSGDASAVRDYYVPGEPYPRTALGKALFWGRLAACPPFCALPAGLGMSLASSFGFMPAFIGSGLAGAAGALSGYAGYRGGKFLGEKASDSALADRVWDYFHPQR